ncbi:hypothetical protein IB277_22405 [Ensifer sp. ENS07]|uniref:hypothetical protein n=1 Tax=Ensifer sp. ENS07 TaxID=2769274 RepID=UPI00177F2B17|nr:hypothetical protein [Ensifer sp. ENS07]MBD9639039.1 hypothetical protein [Ensifer sp. ENS07]
MCTICALTIEFAVEHPEALAVAVSTRQAIETGLLPELDPHVEIDMTQSRHNATVLLTTVQQRLEQVLPPSRLASLPDFYVLMIESRTWGYFHPTTSGFDANANPLPPRVEPDENNGRDNILVLSQAAAEELIRGRLPFDQALELGVAVLDAPGKDSQTIRLALAAAYPADQFSDFVCTELA